MILIIAFFFGCQTQKKETSETNYEYEIESILTENETLYFFQLRDITTDGNTIIVNDYGNNGILSFNMDLKYLRTYGSKGRGPLELLDPTVAIIKNRLIYVADYGNQRFQMFKNDGTIRSSFKFRIFPWSRFCVKSNGNIIVPELGKEYLFSELDINKSIMKMLFKIFFCGNDIILVC